MTANFLGVFGHVNIDFIMDVPRLPHPNSSIEVSGVTRMFGGTGANIAATASALGVKTSLASFVGDDFPEDFQRHLEGAGVDLTDLVRVKDYFTPTCRILTDPEHNQMGIMDQGPMAAMEGFDTPHHTIENCDVLHIGTGRPAYYKRVMEAATGLGKEIHFDPAQEIHYVYTPETFAELLGMANLLFVNESELATALKYLGLEEAGDLLERVDTLVMTLGKRGSKILTANDEINVPAIAPNEVKDPTGAGDSYRGGFYAGLSRGYDLEKCGTLGAAAASCAIENVGTIAKLPTWEDLLSRVGE